MRLLLPGGPGPRIHIPQEQGSPVIPRALGSLFVASYDSQGYSGSILTRLHMGRTKQLAFTCIYTSSVTLGDSHVISSQL
jgi:hypothetical protein